MGEISSKLDKFRHRLAERYGHENKRWRMNIYLEEDVNIPTPSEVSPTNASHLHGLVEHSQFQCHHSILKYLELPKFSDSTNSNTCQFLRELAAIILLEKSFRIRKVIYRSEAPDRQLYATVVYCQV